MGDAQDGGGGGRFGTGPLLREEVSRDWAG